MNRPAIFRIAEAGELTADERLSSLRSKPKATASGRSAGRARATRFLALSTVALLTLATSANFTNTANAAGPSNQILIGLVTKTEVNPYFVKLRQSATAEAEKNGAKLLARF
ncbi:MAG: hypothetical protein JOZ61_05775, partial [Verrucomicrobia bacterium]|nr:hypothetical protein [Verrucomicrobiota bacterium]